MQPQPLPARHVTDYAYPTFDHAKAAGMALAGHLLKRETLDSACLTHCAYTVSGFGLSVALPHDNGPFLAHRKSSKSKAPTTDKAMGKLLEEAFGDKPATEGVPSGDLWDLIPWDILLPMLLSLLERFLRKGK